MAGNAALVTGYPNFVVRRLVQHLADAGETVWVLCKEDEAQARQEFKRYGKAVRAITGDVVCMDLGLSGSEVKEIRREVSHVYHLAGRYYLGTSDEEMALVNIEGTRNLLSFAREMPALERVVHYSTAFVSGSRQGVILEDELVEPPKFRNAFERTKFIAERIARQAMKELPVSVVRPSLIVGDSRSGEIGRLDGPHFFLYVLVNLPLDIHLPLVGKGAYPLNLVPVNYVVDGMIHIARHADAVGRTFHLVDPNPLPSRAVFELICKVANKKPPRRSIPPNLATYLMKMPGLEKSWRSPRLFVETLNQLVLFNAMNATEVLKDTGVTCPPLPSYAHTLVKYLRRGR